MFSKSENQVIQNVDTIIETIRGSKERFRITVIPDPMCYYIYIIMKDLTNNRHFYDVSIQVADFQYINFINNIRNNFIEQGALISKLNKPKNNNIDYIGQQIFIDNLEMDIKINSNIEVLEAVKAHKRVLDQGAKDSHNEKIKTIKTN